MIEQHNGDFISQKNIT